MNNPAFIVDGFTEKLIIQKICPGKPIRRTDLNGKNVQLCALAKKIASIIRILGDNYSPIVIIVDKEKRDISYNAMISTLEELLKKEGVISDFILGVPDIMIENWMIADWDILETDENKPTHTDGSNGSSIIKKIKKTYNKTTDGVSYFLKTNPNNIYNNSPSFRSFFDSLAGKLSCFYLEKVLKQKFG